MARKSSGSNIIFVAIAAIMLVSVRPATAEPLLADFVSLVDEYKLPLTDDDSLDPLIEQIGDRKFALLGESTHGTHEYYDWRARISRRLVEEEGFRFIAIEGDWKAIYRVNEYVRHRTPDGITARDVLLQINRWPTWLWANEEFEVFVEWLRDFNEGLPVEERVGVYGLDMQDPTESLNAVLDWYRKNDSEMAAQIEELYACFAPHASDPVVYLRHLAAGGENCAAKLSEPLVILQTAFLEVDDFMEAKNLFAAKQNARIVSLAEERYRSMLQQDAESWNIRARHMHDLVVRLHELFGAESRGIVWAHNTHVGDARQTSMQFRGEVNMGELLRASMGEDEVFIVGFASQRGSVIAGASWGGFMQEMRLIESQPGTLESLLNDLGHESFLVTFDDSFRSTSPQLAIPQRAVGVVYTPPNEVYVPSVIDRRYDALVFFRDTKALTPIQ